MQRSLPRRVGRYDAFLQIGAGGMARLYLGVQHGPFDVNKLVAIKQIRQEVANDPEFFDMFVSEARIALRLNHPNVVHTYEVLDEAPNYYLIMEFLDGHSLLEVLRRIERIHMPLHEHVWILTQLLAGLHYAHQLCDFDGKPLHIVHRDVTPSNVFVCRSGEVKLLDFGIANAKCALAASHQGMPKGKLGYLAPEQCLSQPADLRADLYSVGVMLWEAVARTRRVTGEIKAAQVQARVQGSEPPIEQVRPDAPAALVAIIRRALATRPEQRYASAQELQNDLVQYLAQDHSRACAESVSRLLPPYFEQDRIELYRAVESHIGGWKPEEPAALGIRRRLQSGRVPAAAKDGLAQAEQSVDDVRGEGETSRLPIDRALLRASRLDQSATVQQALRSGAPARAAARAIWRHLQALPRTRRTRIGAALGLGAVLATATAMWIASHSRFDGSAATTGSRVTETAALKSRDAAQAELEPPTPSTAADEVRDQSPDSLSIAPPAPREQRLAEAVEHQEPITSDSAAAPAPRPASRFGKLRTRAAQSASPASAERPALESQPFATRIEPGMDLPPVVVYRGQPNIDLEDPYKP